MEQWKKSIDEIPTLELLEQKRRDIFYCIQSSKLDKVDYFAEQLDYIDQVIAATKQIAIVFKDERRPGDDEQTNLSLLDNQ